MQRRLVVAMLLSLGACKSKPSDAPPPTPPLAGSGSGSAAAGSAGSAAGSAAATEEPTFPAGLDLAGMDRNTKPGDDFFAYANGGWIASVEIPADRSTYGTGAVVGELTLKRTAALIQEATTAPEGSEARKVGDYYATFMDEAAIEAKGAEPLKPILAAIDAIKDPAELAKALGDTIRADVDAINATNFETANILGLWIAQDLTDPSRYVPFLLQGGLGMPDRDYYLATDDRMKEIRDKYQAHIATVLTLAFVADPETKAAAIMELETRIAKSHATRTESADIKAGTNLWKRADFAKKAPGLDWEVFFDAVGLGAQQDFYVWHPKAVTGIAAAVKAVPLDVWKAYLAFHAIDHAAGLLSTAFVSEGFAFYGSALNGTPKLRDRWKRGVDLTGAALGMAVGKLYVTKYFPESEKQRAAAMVKNIIAAFDKRIDALAWMAPATKAKAKAKLAVLKVGVGYPDAWRDYTGLKIVKGDVLGNADRAERFELARNLAKLGTPIDRDEWVMEPQLVNAVNLPAMNAMNFPAAILQPPFFDPRRPEAMDYGAIGAVIGHEVSHSFDDQGALFDATGKLANWWTKEDFAHFKAASEVLVKQYDTYKPFPDLAVNGTLTLSENIADVAGLAVAYDAYKLATAAKPAADWEGMTPDQQFFVSFAQSWRSKAREAAMRRRVLTDGHSPGEYRADTVRNLDGWYAAFGVKDGEKLALPADKRVRIW